VGHTGMGNIANVVLKQIGLGNHFLKKTFFRFKIFKRIFRFLGYYVLRYKGTRLPECKKNACNNPHLAGLDHMLSPTHGLGKKTTLLFCAEGGLSEVCFNNHR